MQQVNVELGSRGYPVQVGAGLLARNAALLTLAQGRSVAVVTDKSVDRLFGDVLAAGFKGVAHSLVRRVKAPRAGNR
jgi:3-dehydroquinate synthase